MNPEQAFRCVEIGRPAAHERPDGEGVALPAQIGLLQADARIEQRDSEEGPTHDRHSDAELETNEHDRQSRAGVEIDACETIARLDGEIVQVVAEHRKRQHRQEPMRNAECAPGDRKIGDEQASDPAQREHVSVRGGGRKWQGETDLDQKQRNGTPGDGNQRAGQRVPADGSQKDGCRCNAHVAARAMFGVVEPEKARRHDVGQDGGPAQRRQLSRRHAADSEDIDRAESGESCDARQIALRAKPVDTGGSSQFEAQEAESEPPQPDIIARHGVPDQDGSVKRARCGDDVASDLVFPSREARNSHDLRSYQPAAEGCGKKRKPRTQVGREGIQLQQGDGAENGRGVTLPPKFAESCPESELKQGQPEAQPGDT